VARTLAALRRSRKGSIITTFALALPVLIGVSGMAVESGVWYVEKRTTQTQTDAAALSGAFERAKGSRSTVTTAAQHEAVRNGFVNAAPNTIAVNNPPLSGPNTGEGEAVEVVITQAQPLLFAKFFLNSLTISARSVAAVQVTGSACVLALDPSASGAVTVQGSTTADLAGCSVAANSSSSSAINIMGNGALNADSLWTVGNYTKGGSSTLTMAKPPVVNAWELDDPYADVHIPTISGCTATNLSVSSTVTLSPGVYCGGISATSHANITLQPGTYYINAGDLQVASNSTIKCNCTNPTDGVTIVMTSTGDASTIGTVTSNGGANVTLQAPTDAGNPFAGLLFYKDPRATPGATDKFNGGSKMELTGALYAPTDTIDFTGDNSMAKVVCTQIVANQVVFIGNSTIYDTGCPAAGVQPLQITGVKIVE